MTDLADTHDQSQRQPTRWYACSGFQRDLLLAIATHDRLDECPYGLALREWLDARYPDDVGPSRVYTNLDTLIEAELVTRESVDNRTNAYRLTDAARTTLACHGQFVEALNLQSMVADARLQR
jgi:DNA-binding PadR family transcriptional regulator